MFIDPALPPQTHWDAAVCCIHTEMFYNEDDPLQAALWCETVYTSCPGRLARHRHISEGSDPSLVHMNVPTSRVRQQTIQKHQTYNNRSDEAADDEMNCDQSADQLLVHNMSENGGKGQSFLKCFQRCSVLTVGTFDCVIK